MCLKYKSNGHLEPGYYDLNIEECKANFGFNEHRLKLFEGIELAIEELKKVGCETVFLDGSFVTKKAYPSDFDLCWDESGVEYKKIKSLCPGLIDFGFKRKKMKERYGGDIVPMMGASDLENGIPFISYFQEDKQGNDKGIVRISLT